MQASDAAFEEWYRAIPPRLVASLSVAFGDLDLASECADEAVVRSYERWPRVAAMASPQGWTYRVAFNVARRRLRRRRLEDGAAARARSPGGSSAADELWLPVADLPERQRAAVVLRHVAHLREHEIAEVMGITRGGVSSTLRAAYRTLRIDLSEPAAEEVP